MSLILKSNQVFIGSLSPEFDAYKARVAADGGVLKNESKTLEAFMFMRSAGINARNMHSATSPTWGVKLSGDNVVKMYNLFDASGDVVVTAGSYALKDKGNGIFGFSSAGSVSNRMSTVATMNSKSISYFSSLDATPSFSGYLFLVMLYTTTTPKERAILVTYDYNLKRFDLNAYGNSGEIAGVNTGDNIGLSVNTSEGLVAYQDGAVVGTDNSISESASSVFTVDIASPEINDTGAGFYGDMFINIIANDLTKAQNLALSKFASDFV